jgi:septation ring formation regulator EzrA
LEERLSHLNKNHEELKSKIKNQKISGDPKGKITSVEELEKSVAGLNNENKSLKILMTGLNQKLEAQRKAIEEKDKKSEGMMSEIIILNKNLKEKTHEVSELKYEVANLRNEVIKCFIEI